MDCDHEDEHGGLSPTGSKSSFREDEAQTNSAPAMSTFQHSGQMFAFTCDFLISKL